MQGNVRGAYSNAVVPSFLGDRTIGDSRAFVKDEGGRVFVHRGQDTDQVGFVEDFYRFRGVSKAKVSCVRVLA